MRLAAAALLLACAPVVATAGGMVADDVAWGCEDAGYAQPVDRPGGIGYRALVLLVHTDQGVIPATAELPEGEVYTEGAPTCADLDGDGEAEVVTAISGPQGDWLTVYGKRTGPVASTDPAPVALSLVGAVDLDADGTPELAWLEDPDGAGRLRVARLRDRTLAEVASAEGFARPESDGASAGAADGCDDHGPGLILPAADGAGLLRVSLADGRLRSEPVAEAAGGGAASPTCAPTRNEETQ